MIVLEKNTDISSWDKVDKTDKESLSPWFLQQICYNTLSDMKLLNQFWKANFDKMPNFILFIAHVCWFYSSWLHLNELYLNVK